MTQPTIKERMDEIRDQIEYIAMSWVAGGRQLSEAKESVKKSRKEMRKFARLICEEMKNSVHYCSDDFSSVLLKAREILKALK